MTISEEILNSRFGSGFNAQFGENLIQDLSENQLEYKEYFEFLFICKDYALPILRNSPETIELIRDMDNMNNVDKLLLILFLVSLWNNNFKNKNGLSIFPRIWHSYCA